MLEAYHGALGFRQSQALKLVMRSLLLADKMWEDKPVRNSSLAKLFPVRARAQNEGRKSAVSAQRHPFPARC